MHTQPIGVLDSGVGGFTVLAAIHKELPNESTVYIGDSANAPYGKKSPEEIFQLSKKLILFLLTQKAKLIVVACNTITVHSIERLRQTFPEVPIVGTVPVVKTAAEITKKKKIGLLVTEATAKSVYNQRLIDTFAADCQVTIVGTNKLVPLIEAEKHALLPEMIAQELAPFKQHGVDVVILGSTHFPILRSYIAAFMGEEVQLLDSGGAVARQVRRILTNNTTVNSSETSHAFYTTGKTPPFATIAQRVLGKKIKASSISIP